MKKVLPYPNRSTTLAKSQTYTLVAEQVNGRLQIYLDIFKKDLQTGTRELVRKFSKLILLGHKQEIRRQFKTIASLIDHLKNSQNYAINDRDGILSIFKDRRKIIDIYLQEKQVPGLIREDDDGSVFKKMINKPNLDLYSEKKANDDDEYEAAQKKFSAKSNKTRSLVFEEKYEHASLYDEDEQFGAPPPAKSSSLPQSIQRYYQARIKSLQTRLDIVQQQGQAKDDLITKIMNKLNEQDKRKEDMMRPFRDQIVNIYAKIKKINAALEIKDEEAEDEIVLLKIKDWIDMESYWYKFVKLKENFIFAEKANRIAVFGKNPIAGKFKLCIQVKKLKDYIGLGLADSQYKNSPQILQKQNTILYKNNGDLYYKGKYRQSLAVKVGEGDTVQMFIHQEQSRIEWKIGQKRVLSIQDCGFLKSEVITWVPFIYFDCKGDCVELIC